MTFNIADWLILVIYLVLTMAVGFWVKRYVEDLSGYLVAGRRIKVSLGVATFAATEIGTITFLYFGELGYVSGFSCFIIGILAMLAYMVDHLCRLGCGVFYRCGDCSDQGRW